MSAIAKHTIELFFSLDPLSHKDQQLILDEFPVFLKLRLLKKKRNREESIRAYAHLKQILTDIHKESFDALKFSPEGKPYLHDSETQFSISHSQSVVVIAFSKKYKIGVDVELKQGKIPVATGQMFFTEAEQKSIPSEFDFVDLWSRKEAFIKAIGSTMFKDAKIFDVRGSYIEHKTTRFHFHETTITPKIKVWMCIEKKSDVIVSKKRLEL